MVEDKENRPSAQGRKEQDEADATPEDSEVQDPPVAAPPLPRVSPSLYGYDKSQWP